MMNYQKIDVTGADARFPSFLQGFNKRWSAGNCQAIYLCYTPQGAAQALDDAISFYGQNVKIKSGGHCYENFVFNAGTLAIIDVTPMDGYGYDNEKGYYLESGGTNWTAFQALFRDYSKVLPAGSCYSVGLGGHICGGGYGLLSRLNGLTVDWLTGVDVVVKPDAGNPAGVLYVAADAENAEERALFWAHCGGGGGNFGIITRYYFKTLPDAPAAAMLTSLAFQWSDLDTGILQNLLNWFAGFSAREDNWRQFGIFALNHSAATEIHLTIQTVVNTGEDENAVFTQFVQPILNQLLPIAPYHLMSRPALGHRSNFFQTQSHTLDYTFYEAVQTLNGSGANQRGKYKSAYMCKSFPADQVAAIYQALTTTPPGADMSQSLLQVDSYGGKINTVAPDATAIPQRSSIMKLQYQTYWGDDTQDAIYLTWIRDFYSAVYQQYGGVPNPELDPDGTVDGCYYNYPDVDLNGPGNDPQPALQLYFGPNLPALQAVKQLWDPNNYFNSAQSIN